MYGTGEVPAVKLDDSELVILKLETGSFVRFQPVTGPHCNALPLYIHKKVTKDKQLVHVDWKQTSLVFYGVAKITVRLRVCQHQCACVLEFRLFDESNFGIKACLAMSIKDKDLLNKPKITNAPVFAVKGPRVRLTKEDIIKKFKNLFGETFGQLNGEYRMKLDESVSPVQHAPRRAAVAVRPKLKEALGDLEAQGIIAVVTTPT